MLFDTKLIVTESVLLSVLVSIVLSYSARQCGGMRTQNVVGSHTAQVDSPSHHASLCSRVALAPAHCDLRGGLVPGGSGPPS